VKESIQNCGFQDAEFSETNIEPETYLPYAKHMGGIHFCGSVDLMSLHGITLMPHIMATAGIVHRDVQESQLSTDHYLFINPRALATALLLTLRLALTRNRNGDGDNG
jgi:hypothetical protein